MRYFEKNSIKLLFLTFLSIFLIGFRIKYDIYEMITNEDIIEFKNRQSLYMNECVYNVIRIIAVFAILFQQKLEHSYNVKFLNFFFVILYVSKMTCKTMFTLFLCLELYLHIHFICIFSSLNKHARVKFLLQRCRTAGCGVINMKKFLIRRSVVSQRKLLYIIVLINNSLFFYDDSLNIYWFLLLIFVDFIISGFEKYEIAFLKIASILLWSLIGIFATYRMIYGDVDGVYQFKTRVFLCSVFVYLHAFYNILDFLNYGKEIHQHTIH